MMDKRQHLSQVTQLLRPGFRVCVCMCDVRCDVSVCARVPACVRARTHKAAQEVHMHYCCCHTRVQGVGGMG